MKNYLIIFLISMLPIVELRGAIPAGAAMGLPPVANAAMAVVGNLLPVPFILLFIPKILDLLERIRWFAPVVRWVRKKADKYRDKVFGEPTPTAEAVQPTEGIAASADEPIPPTAACAAQEGETPPPNPCEKKTAVPKNGRKTARRHAAFWGLMLFVLIPLPGTGAWTGSLVASLFNMPKRLSFPAVFLGVIGAAVIMSLASYGVVGFLKIFL